MNTKEKNQDMSMSPSAMKASHFSKDILDTLQSFSLDEREPELEIVLMKGTLAALFPMVFCLNLVAVNDFSDTTCLFVYFSFCCLCF